MDKTKRSISILTHIVEYCDEIAKTHLTFGDSFEEFENRKDYFKSVAMSLLQIGELINHLPKSFTEKYCDVPWERIVGLRNIITHGYKILEHQRIWETSHNYTLELKKRCLEIIAEVKV